MKFLLPLALLAATPPAAPPQGPLPELPAARDPALLHPLGLALTATSAFGVTHAPFFNQLVGARLDYRFTAQFAFGGSFAYANLEGKDRRVHEVLPEVFSQYGVPLRGEAMVLPLRLSLGYLPKNGPTLRLAAGLDFALSSRVSLELVPLEAMIWINRERPEVSLDASIAVRAAF